MSYYNRECRNSLPICCERKQQAIFTDFTDKPTCGHFHIVSLLACVSLALGTDRAGRWAGDGRKPWAAQGDSRGWECGYKISVPGSDDGKLLARRGVFFTFISWNLQSHLERDGWKKAGACGHSPSKRANNHQSEHLFKQR